jgi:membrane protein involved in colicin uptake
LNKLTAELGKAKAAPVAKKAAKKKAKAAPAKAKKAKVVKKVAKPKAVKKVKKAPAKKAKKAPKAAKAKAKAAAGKGTVLDSVLDVIAKAKNGANIATLKKKTKLEPRQLSNALYKLTKKGTIEARSRGVYFKK